MKGNKYSWEKEVKLACEENICTHLVIVSRYTMGITNRQDILFIFLFDVS